mgnify:CR=1 FL=1
MIVLIDNYDSFTFNIYHYFGELGAKIEVFRNDQIKVNDIIKLKPKALIISPGPCTPDDAGICVELIRKSKTLFPILGICLGHQCIGQALGGKIIQCKEIMHGKIDKIFHENHGIFSGIEKEFAATRYHSLIVENSSLPDNLEIIAKTKNNIIMGIANTKEKIFGLQFHPESIGTNDGKTIFKNFLNMIDA